MPGPPSVRSMTTHASEFDIPGRPPLIVTRADMRNSQAAYEHLLAAAKGYTTATLQAATAASEFACALDECARLKGAHQSGPGLQAASGLHFLMSNYHQVLADSFWKDFSIPLLSHFDSYRQSNLERQLAHEKAIAEKSKVLKETESRNMRTGRRKERDLNAFRKALQELQAQVDGLDDLKCQYYHEVLQSEEDAWEYIHDKVAHMVRSQLEISERITSKGLSDPILEPMLAAIPDPFGSYGPPTKDDQIFSILQPNGVLSGSGSAQDGVVPDYEGNLSPSGLMSPNAPAAGLPRMGRSGAPGDVASPRSLSPTPSPARIGREGSSGGGQAGLGLSLAAASAKLSSMQGSSTPNKPMSTQPVLEESIEENSTSSALFGSDGGDYDDDLLNSRKARRGASGSEGNGLPDVQTSAPTSRLAANPIDAAARAKHALSIIDESANAKGTSEPRSRTSTNRSEEEASGSEIGDKTGGSEIGDGEVGKDGAEEKR